MQGASYQIFSATPNKFSTTNSWIDLLGLVKQGVSTVGFESQNNTMVELRDGNKLVLDCKVFLKHDKTVRLVI